MPAAREPEAPLLDALLELNPASLLVIGNAAAAAADAFHARRPGAAVRHVHALAELAAEPAARYEVAAVSGVVGSRPDPLARELLAALRDRHSRCVLVQAPAGAWRLTDYLALGFELRSRATAELGSWELYWYDFDRYNPEREWNNAEHWANPENFKRYRW